MGTLTMTRENTRSEIYAIDLDELETVREAERRLDEIYAGRSSTTPLTEIAKRYGLGS